MDASGKKVLTVFPLSRNVVNHEAVQNYDSIPAVQRIYFLLLVVLFCAPPRVMRAPAAD
jgi:hypothetical protein